MNRFYRGFQKAVHQLELYELVGIIVTLAAIITFFVAGGQLDQLKGTPGYHWKPLEWVYSYYRTFLPKAILYGAIAMFGYHVIRKRTLREFPGIFLSIVRLFAPFCVLLAVYRTLTFFIPLFNHDKDSTLLRIDQWMFGTQPSLWLQAYTHPWLTNYMSFAYAVWFPLIFITIILLFVRNRKATSEFISTTMITFYIGYIFFTLVPAIGPQFTLVGQYHVPLHGLVVDAIKKYNDDITIARDCFPSLHTGITIVMMVYMYRYWRKWTWLYAPVGISIIASTIYLREHYAIDVIAGTILAIALSFLCPKLVHAWNGYRTKATVPMTGQETITVHSSVASPLVRHEL